MLIKKSKTIIVSIILLFITIAMLLLVFVINEAKGKNLTYDQKVAIFAEENKTFKKGQIVFIGDSITQNYRLDKYYDNMQVKCYNRGISGDRTDWLLYRLQTSLFDLSPSKVILMIGTNDINSQMTAEDISKSYQKILELISTNLPTAEVYCMSIIPQNLNYSDKAYEFNQKIIATNNQIESLAQKYNYEYVDLYNKLKDENGLLNQKYSKDGLHLNNKGYQIWTNEMKNILV